ncbi:hypothetical protein WKI13_11450 [Teredinibacter turnerae]|uniref:hypothetical protein n=1 Tax=Teredinibacter turnerae TaxID=2426 RepID=UPI00035D2AB8|nr:hypothetical protein [Teredinibacter turnerae]
MYKPLFSLTLPHKYCENCVDFNYSVVPDEETARLMAALDWMTIPRPGGFQMAWNDRKWTELELREQFANEWMLFEIRPKDRALFFQVTDLPKPKKTEAKDQTENKKNASSGIRALDSYRIDWQTQNEDLELSFLNVDAIPGLQELGEINSLPPVSEIIIKPTDKRPVNIRLASLYKSLKSEPAIVLSFPVVDVLGEPLGQSRNTRVQLNALAYRVKYYLLNRTPSERLSVVYPDYTFHSTIENISEGRAVQTFVSQRPLELKSKHKAYPSLVDTYRGRQNILIDCLPLPDSCNLAVHLDGEDIPTTFAESFINE